MIDVERLAEALHEIGGEFCDPFTDDHPVGMHNSQVAAIAATYQGPPAAPAGLDVLERRELEELRVWVAKRRARDKRSRDHYRAAHPEAHRKSARESMARLRAAARAAKEEQS